MIKAIFLDFDGTFYSHSMHKAPDSTVKGLKLMQEKGTKVYLATGRPKYELDEFYFNGFKFDGYILKNGAETYDKHFNLIEINWIEGQLKDALLDIFINKKMPMAICEKNSLYINEETTLIKEIVTSVNTDVPEVREYTGDDFNMAVIYLLPEDRHKIAFLDEISEATYWHPHAIDIVPKGHSKANGVKKVIEQLGIKQEETMAFGDGHNDIDMLKFCNIGVALGNGMKEIKEVADYVTDDIDNDGVYNALKKYNLI